MVQEDKQRRITKTPSISIIIPTYNCAQYIHRCIDSILTQSFQDFELIIIDDGSKDDTYKILQRYEDARVRICTQKNQGPAKTRNRGIKMARGEYLMFIDSDDYINPGYLERYYREITSQKADLVIGGYKHLKDGTADFIRQLKPGKFAKYIVVGPVCKIYRKSFIDKHKITFLDTTGSEDVYFSVLLYSKNPQISIIDDTGYNYCYNAESISNTAHKGFNDEVDILDLMQKINFTDIDDVELNQYFILRYIIWYLLYSGKSATADKFYQEYQRYFAWLTQNISYFTKNPNIRMLGPAGELPKLGFTIFMFMTLHRLHLIKLFAKVYCRG